MSVSQTMVSRGESSADSYVYILRSSAPEAEWTQLDQMHVAWNDYMGNVISYAPIRNPKTILELGAGTGAWATQAATTFPEATVTAADLATLPARTYPPNLKYAKADFTKPFPFDNGFFDVVHTRLVLIHVPHPKSILDRMMRLTRPGGWFLVEDMCFDIPPGPDRTEADKVITAWRNSHLGKDRDPQVGEKFVGWLKESGLFDVIESKAVPVTRGKAVDDPALQRWGEVMRHRCKEGYRIVRDNLRDDGDDSVKDIDFGDKFWDAEDGSVFVWLHFVWGRRKTA